MKDFFQHLDPEQKMRLDVLSRLAHNTRQARAGLLAWHGVDDESALHARIVAGALGEHPGWEHYVGARLMTATRDAARAAMSSRPDAPDAVEALPHLRARQAIEEGFPGALASPVVVKFDALEVSLANGLFLTLHVAGPGEYAFAWQVGSDASRRAIIDTAPCHPSLPGAPAHLHHADGRVLADTVTRAGADPVDNVRALVSELIANPRFALED